MKKTSSIGVRELSRRSRILDASIKVFGKFGYKKTSVEDLAAAAGLSKPGLYLHFSGKEEIFAAALLKYLDEGLLLVEAAVQNANAGLHERITDAMDAWFGRHLVTFSADALDVIDTGNRQFAGEIEKYKASFKTKITKAIAENREFKSSKNPCSAREIADTLFLCGLAWKDQPWTASDFRKKLSVCVRVCCQLER